MFNELSFAKMPVETKRSTQNDDTLKEKNGVIESLAELKFDPGFRVIGEYLSQIDLLQTIFFIYNRLNLNYIKPKKKYIHNFIFAN